jgi:hypothetical protein
VPASEFEPSNWVILCMRVSLYACSSQTDLTLYQAHSQASLRASRLLENERRRIEVMLLLAVLLGVTLIALRLVSADPTVEELPYNTCVVQFGVKNSDGTTEWMPGYAYPSTPISGCQDKTDELGEDALGRTIVFHQFIVGSQNSTVDTSTTVTSTSTTRLTSTSATTLTSTSTTTLATPEATQNSVLAIFIVTVLAVVVLRKRAKPSGG